MRKTDVLDPSELPEGFDYPRPFRRLLELGLTDLEPWYVLEGEPLREVQAGLAHRYPGRHLVPFAKRQDNDDVACWRAGSGEAVFVIHDFASPGWEDRARFPTFYDWLRRAVEDLIEFDT